MILYIYIIMYIYNHIFLMSIGCVTKIHVSKDCEVKERWKVAVDITDPLNPFVRLSDSRRMESKESRISQCSGDGLLCWPQCVLLLLPFILPYCLWPPSLTWMEPPVALTNEQFTARTNSTTCRSPRGRMCSVSLYCVLNVISRAGI